MDLGIFVLQYEQRSLKTLFYICLSISDFWQLVHNLHLHALFFRLIPRVSQQHMHSNVGGFGFDGKYLRGLGLDGKCLRGFGIDAK